MKWASPRGRQERDGKPHFPSQVYNRHCLPPATPGLESYWENRYHHEDSPQISMDVGFTLYHSGARLSTRAVGQLGTTSRSKCEFYSTTVLEAHSYHHSDTFKVLSLHLLFQIRAGIQQVRVSSEVRRFLSPHPMHDFRKSI